MIPKALLVRNDFFSNFITDDLASLELWKEGKRKTISSNGVTQQQKCTTDVGMHGWICSLGFELEKCTTKSLLGWDAEIILGESGDEEATGIFRWLDLHCDSWNGKVIQNGEEMHCFSEFPSLFKIKQSICWPSGICHLFITSKSYIQMTPCVCIKQELPACDPETVHGVQQLHLVLSCWSDSFR